MSGLKGLGFRVSALGFGDDVVVDLCWGTLGGE